MPNVPSTLNLSLKTNLSLDLDPALLKVLQDMEYSSLEVAEHSMNY